MMDRRLFMDQIQQLGLLPLVDNIRERGGRALLIGGAVIDTIHNRAIKDWDIEIYHLPILEIVSMLEAMGLESNAVGKSFGVIKTQINGLELDLSIPRTENKNGVGHKGFSVQLEPNLSPKEAGRRRDLTINSMYLDMHTGEILDPFNGLADLNEGIIRATDAATFVEDPLRVLRIMQLLPRKGRVVDAATIELCRSIINTFDELPSERVIEEFNKLLLKAAKPSLGLQFLRDCGWIQHFPELKDLIDCPQNPEWHPEGDVWIHTLMVVDNAALLRDELEEDQRLSFMYGALLHDIGKPSTTVLPLCTAHGHAEAGEPLATTFMQRITKDSKLLKEIPLLVRLHMRAGQLYRSEAKIGAWKRLHNQYRLDVLGYLSKADSAGRTGRSIHDVHEVSEKCFELFSSFGKKEIPALVLGRDLIELGIDPSPEFGKILKEAYELQMDGMEKAAIIEVIKEDAL